MNETEIPASWVADYVEPEYDVFQEWLEQDKQEYYQEQEHLAFLRTWFNRGVM